MPDPSPPSPPTPQPPSRLRWAWWLLAWLSLGLGLLGVVLPGLPTVPFILLSAYAAARGSRRLHERLLRDPGIIRHRGKIESALGNAKRAATLVEEFGSLADYLWRFAPEPDAKGRPRRMTRAAVIKLTESDASRALAFSPQVEVTGEGYQAGYGFGWRITGDTLWHSGETIGFRNVIVRWPQRRLTVVLLSNRNEPEPYRTALEIGALFLRD